MAFDAGMIAAIVNELNLVILGARVEKIYQPEKDELLLLLHRERDSIRLSISASSNNPRINLTQIAKENPKTPLMFCMLMRKHLTGARITKIQQLGFERAVELELEAYDELGFLVKRYLIAEIMGKYSNLIFCNETKKIINAIKIVDFTTSHKRQVLPGMQYELPPLQEKQSPLEATEESFYQTFTACAPDLPADKFILKEYLGISALVAREIIYRTTKSCDTLLANCDCKKLWFQFQLVMNAIREKQYTPTLIKDLTRKPIEYCFMEIHQYENAAIVEKKEDFAGLIDEFFLTRDRSDRIKQRASDIFKLLANAETRLHKKIVNQENDIRQCAEKDKFKLWADLITGSMYQVKRGMTSVRLPNYYSESLDGTLAEVEVPLDTRLTPPQNAQKYYKRYTKAKTAEIELAKQIQTAKEELVYVDTVFDSLTRADTENDLNEIRQELYQSGYASKMKNYTTQKLSVSKPMEFRSDSGYRILCGKNNHQNDMLTTKIASKLDYWFHVKNVPGSHTVLLCNGEEPSELDFTQAATIAAYYSKASEGQNVPVNYTLIKNVKKPSGAKPGLVTYHTNWTAYVTPDIDVIKKWKK